MTAHELWNHRISRDSGTALALSLTALGPFRPSGADTKNVNLDASDEPLGFSQETRGLEAHVSTPDAGSFFGYTDRRTPQGIDVLLWPDREACTLEIPEYDGYPSTRPGQALGFSPALGAVLVAGQDDPDPQENSLLFDANTGILKLPRFDDHRAYATVTPFGDGFLLAGGENPSSGEDLDQRDRWENAYPYSPERDERGDPIDLQWARTRHAALALDDGATLLIGGTSDGLVRQFEAVYPGSTTSNTFGLATLTVGRLEPIALRLTDGRILVGGGTLLIGSPVGTVEWFSASATQKLSELALPPLRNRVFAATPGGGALTVASCDPDACTSGLEARWLGPEATNSRQVQLPSEPVCVLPDRPWLVPGSDGAVWLACTGDTMTSAPVFRFEAWPATYADPTLFEANPRFEPSDVTLNPPPLPGTAPISTGPDSFVWISGKDGGNLAGIRFGARGSLSQEAPSLVGPEPFRPLHLAPDRPVPLDAPPLYEYGALTLSATESGLNVWVTDTLYDDFTVTLRLADAAAAAPGVWVGTTLVGSREACPWPAVTAGATLHAERRGTRVTLDSGSARKECTVASGALAVGFRAPDERDCANGEVCASVLTGLSVDRD